MGKKQRKRELKRLWRYTESLNAWFENALNRCEDLVGAPEKTRGASTCSKCGPGVGSDSVAKLGDDVQPEEPIRIFSGDYSGKMWDAINNARMKEDLRGALYFVCCRLQEFESLNEHDHQVIRDLVDGIFKRLALAEFDTDMMNRLWHRLDALEQLCEKMRTQADWLEAAYGEFNCGLKAECTNERCAQARRCAHCATSLGEAYARAGERLARFEDRLDALEQRQRMDDAELAATVPPDSRSVLGYHGPDDDLDEPLPRMPLENSMVDMTFKVVGQGQPLSVLGCGPISFGLATEEFLETVPQC